MKKEDRIYGKGITNTVLGRHFYTFTASLKLHNPKYKEIRLTKPELQEPTEHYICPLCVEAQIVVNGNILIKFEEFTLDHVPPESIGGKTKLMTCKVCNNTAGEYEAELLEKLRFHCFGDKKEGAAIKKLSVKKDLNDTLKHKGFMTTDESGAFILDFPEHAKENNPELKYILDNFQDGGLVQEIQVTIKTPDEDKLSKALLKSAYLLCFIHWGYEFIYSEIGYKIRKVLQGQEKYPITLPVAFVAKEKQELPIGVGIILKPAELQSYYVTRPITEGNNSYTAMVIIPPPIKDGWHRLKEIHEYYNKNKGKDYEYVLKPLVQALPHNLNGYSESWDDREKILP
jgi:HNH endonuclease